MKILGILIAIAISIYFFVGPGLGIAASRRTTKVKGDLATLWNRLEQISQRLSDLTTSVEALKKQLSVPETPPVESAAAEAAVPKAAPKTTETRPELTIAMIAERPTAAVTEPVGEVVAPAVTAAAREAAAAAKALGIVAAAPETAPVARKTVIPPVARSAGPIAQMRESILAAFSRGAEAEGWESIIGGRWLNNIGIIVLVIGVAWFLGYSLRYLGPFGKVMTGCLTAVALLGGGMFLERLARYRAFGRTLMGGGWALLYFTAYAAHNVEATRIILDPLAALDILLLVAAGMILHSFKYRSQVVTGFAFGLGFMAIAFSPVTSFSLIATAILAGSLVAALRVMPWYHLAIVGVAATYGEHFLWLGRQMGEASATLPHEGFWLSQGTLAIYWVMFVAVALIRKPANSHERDLAFFINVINTASFLCISTWQVLGVFANDLYVFAAGAAFAYVASAYVMRKSGARELFLVDTAVAIFLIAVTYPLARRTWSWPADWLGLYWAAEAAGVLAVGHRLKEISIRVAAYILSAASICILFAINFGIAPVGREVALLLTVPPVIVFLYYLFEWLQTHADSGEIRPEARDIGVGFGYAASTVLAVLLWIEASRELVSLAWLAVGLGSIELGLRGGRPHVRGQGYYFCVLAIAGLFLINLYGVDSAPQDGAFPNFAIVALGIVALYYVFWRLDTAQTYTSLRDVEQIIRDLACHAAAALLTVLLWIEVRHEFVSIAWLAAAVIAIELGLRGQWAHVRGQGYYFCALGIAGLFLINLYHVIPTPPIDTILRPAIVALGIVALYYVFWRLGTVQQHASVGEVERAIRDLVCHAATALLAVLSWKELDAVAVALAWGFIGLVLFEVGDRVEPKTFKAEAHVLMTLAFGRLFMANLTAPGEAFGLSHRLITVLPIVAMSYYLFARLRDGRRAGTLLSFERQLDRAYSYGAAVLLVALARFELGRAYAVIAWAPLMVIYLVLGVERAERDFRFQSYIIALLSFARVWATNIFLVGSFYGIPERFATTIPAIAGFLWAALYAIRRPAAFGVEEVKQHWERSLVWADKHSRTLFAVLGSGLISVLLYHEVSGNLLTIAWAVQGLLLVALGITVYERGFRLYSLALLLACVLKLVFIDLEGVETLYRIVSYIVLGLVLLAASFAYTRYREAIGRYL